MSEPKVKIPSMGGDNYAATERAHPEPEGTLNKAGFSIDPY